MTHTEQSKCSSWRVPAPYDPGDVVQWNGLRLVCTREHYAGEYAVHPWDPGDGWSERARATLWRPARWWERGLSLRLVRGYWYDPTRGSRPSHGGWPQGYRLRVRGWRS